MIDHVCVAITHSIINLPDESPSLTYEDWFGIVGSNERRQTKRLQIGAA